MMIKPDYLNSNLNLMNSILKYYNIENKYPTLKKMDEFLNKKYKNIVLFVLDGLGKNYLVNNMNKGLFIDNLVGEMTAVFPPTTVASTTTYQSCEPPVSHGWIGWTMYFKEVQKIVTTFNGYVPLENKTIDLSYQNVIKYETVFEKLRNNKIKSYNITHDFIVREQNEYSIGYADLDDGLQKTRKIINNGDTNFIYFYYSYPDYYMHEFGVFDEKVKNNVLEIEKKIKQLVENSQDTLYIITADHGHMNVSEYICFDDYQDLKEMCLMPFSVETRATSIFIKDGFKEQFKIKFNQYFGKDFLLLSHNEVFSSNILGFGDKHQKVDDFIGDYLAIAISDKALLYEKTIEPFKGAHAGLTEDEVVIPLIVIEK